MFPETVGRSLEEIEDVFAQGHVFSPWKIKRNVGLKTLGDVTGQKGHVERASDVRSFPPLSLFSILTKLVGKEGRGTRIGLNDTQFRFSEL